MKLSELTARLRVAAFDGAPLCSDCLENRSSYPKDPDYMMHGFEYQQHLAPPAYRHSGEPPAAAPLCNGTASRSRQDGKEVPQNNNRDRKGAWSRCADGADG